MCRPVDIQNEVGDNNSDEDEHTCSVNTKPNYPALIRVGQHLLKELVKVFRRPFCRHDEFAVCETRELGVAECKISTLPFGL